MNRSDVRIPTVHRTRVPSIAVAIALCLLGAGAAPVVAQSTDAKGKISRNFYRMPYADGDFLVGFDYVTHGNTPAGGLGFMDLNGANPGIEYVLTAMADGEVTGVSDSGNDCGCHMNYGPCANSVTIRHANNEVSTYLHIRQNSALVEVGEFVVAGQPIGHEGDVGRTCGNTPPRAGGCIAAVPAGAGGCGRHVHMFVMRESTGERVNPMVCGGSGLLFRAGGHEYAQECSPPTFCIVPQHYQNRAHDGFGDMFVYQGADISASSFEVRNSAGVVFHSQSHVRLLPGFKAGAGNAYFRAEIGPCSQTAPNL